MLGAGTRRMAVAYSAASFLPPAPPTGSKRMSVLQHSYVEANGVRLHCVASGRGSLILFLHGFPEFWYLWREQLRAFGTDHLAVAPDMRGYNLSDKPAATEAYRPRVLLEDIRGVADHFRAGGKLTLVGHDWGGALAWAFAMAHPEYLHKLVIVNAPHPAIFGHLLAADPQQREASQYMLLFRSPRAEEILARDNYAALRRQLLAPLLDTGVFTAADEAAYLAAWSQPGALTGSLNYYRASRLVPAPRDAPLDPAAHPLRVEAGMIVNVPTLVIWGERDTALSVRNLEGLEGFVPHLSVRRIPAGSHWVIHERRAEVNGYIRAFISA